FPDSEERRQRPLAALAGRRDRGVGPRPARQRDGREGLCLRAQPPRSLRRPGCRRGATLRSRCLSLCDSGAGHIEQRFGARRVEEESLAVALRRRDTDGGGLRAALAGASVALLLRPLPPVARRRLECRDLAAALRPLLLHACAPRLRARRAARAPAAARELALAR